jgi:general secretion pathway protein D
MKVEHLSAEEIAKVLQPFVSPGGDVMAYPRGNLVILSDLASSVERLKELVRAFDTDTFRELHTQVYHIEHANVEDLGEELKGVLEPYGVTPKTAEEHGAYIIPLKRLNSIVVIGFNPEIFAQVEHWLQVLDVPPEKGGGRTVHVYAVENTKAADLAQVLGDLYGGEGGGGGGGTQPGGGGGGSSGGFGSAGGGETSFGGGTGQSSSMSGGVSGGGSSGLGGGVGGGIGGGSRRGGRSGSGATGGTAGGGGTQSVTIAPKEGEKPIFKEEVRIVADSITNSLVILATARDYEMIRDVLRKLDIVPRQVLIEVTVAEVSLEGDLQFGVEWAIANRGIGSILGSSTSSSTSSSTGGDTSTSSSTGGTSTSSSTGGTSTSSSTGGTSTSSTSSTSSGVITPRGFPSLPQAANRAGHIAANGLSTLITDRSQFFALITALSKRARTNILSTPHVIAADNREAHILVGQQVPILTSSAVSTFAGGAPVVNSIQYRDTGNILTILPQVNSAGLVNMEIRQEVSAVAATAEGTVSNSPTFTTREAETTIVVQNGESVLLGGIIDDQLRRTRSGVPFLMDLPVLGRLFRLETEAVSRTELLVLITPYVIRDRDEARAITAEFESRISNLKAMLERVRRPKTESAPAASTASPEPPTP